MSVAFLDILRQVSGHLPGEPSALAEPDPSCLFSWSDSRAGEALDWNAILEESGSSQFALHIFLMGIWEGAPILQR